MGIILNDVEQGIVVSNPDTLIGGNDSLKFSITLKPDESLYDYTTGDERFFKAKKNYLILSYTSDDGFCLEFLWSTGSKGVNGKFLFRVSNSDKAPNIELSPNQGNVFADGLPHELAFQWFVTGHITYFIDGVTVGTDRWNLEIETKYGFRGRLLPKHGKLILGNNITLDGGYPFLGEYSEVKIAEETIDEEGDPVFADYSKFHTNNDIELSLISSIGEIAQYTEDLDANDMVMYGKGYKKGRFNRKLMYRDNNKTTLELEGEAARLELESSEDVILQNKTSTVFVRIE